MVWSDLRGEVFFVIVSTEHLLALNIICHRSFCGFIASFTPVITLYDTQSSAESLILELVCAVVSFMYKININGPKLNGAQISRGNTQWLLHYKGINQTCFNSKNAYFQREPWRVHQRYPQTRKTHQRNL